LGRDELVSWLGTTDQVVPSKVSTSVWLATWLGDALLKAPTAVHELIETHDTPKRKLWLGVGLGLGTTDQVVPSHISTRVRSFPKLGIPEEAVPAATQKLVETHDTPLRTLANVPGLGLGVTDQVLPSHISTRVPGDSPELLLTSRPTATQKCFETQDTPPSRKLSRSGLGLGTTDQVVPSHISTTVVLLVELGRGGVNMSS
jgi:hypothetical protein